MDFVMWEVEFYEQPSGRCPVKDFLSKVNKETELPFILHVFSLAEEHGNNLEMPHSEPLRDKILALRVRAKKVRFRFLYFFDDRKIIITHGLKKKTGKMPDREIEKALKYRAIYFERK